MEQIIDKVLIVLACIAICMRNGVNAWTLCAMLVTIIFVCINMVFDIRAVHAALNVLFIIMCIINWHFIYFIPVYIYDNLYYGNFWWICAAVVPIASYPDRIPNILIISFFAVMLTVKTVRYNKRNTEYHEIQDLLSETNRMMEQMKKDVLEKQDYEIHTAKLSERNRIAREIHDNVGHMLSRAILQTGAIKAICKDEVLGSHISMLHDTLNTAMNSIRESVHDLRDESFDLEQMLKDMVSEYSDRINIKLDYDMGNAVSKNIKFGFAAIVREAVTNTIKHSNADTVLVVVREHPGFFQLLVEDNGTGTSGSRSYIPHGETGRTGEGIGGHNRKSVQDNESGMGIDNMRERVKALGGNIEISRDKGFRIFVTIFKQNR